MYRVPLVIALVLSVFGGCQDHPAPPTGPDSTTTAPPPPADAIGIRFQANCPSVWDRQIDGEWLGLVMFTDESEVLVDTLPAGRHEVTVTRWMPAPVVVLRDSITVDGSTEVKLAC